MITITFNDSSLKLLRRTPGVSFLPTLYGCWLPIVCLKEGHANLMLSRIHEELTLAQATELTETHRKSIAGRIVQEIIAELLKAQETVRENRQGEHFFDHMTLHIEK